MPTTDLTHTQKHGPKYFLAGALAILVSVLQVFGTLSPIICTFVPKADTCKQIGVAATVAAQELGTIKLDDGSVLELQAAYPDGGDL